MPRRRPSRVLVSVVGLAVLLAACDGNGSSAGGSGGTSQTTAPPSAIYTAADPPPPGPAGDVLAQEPLFVPPGATGATPAVAWRVLYRSQNVRGEPVAVSGLVVRPAGPAPPGGWPVLSWAHGTTGSADLCAPSLAGVLGIPFVDRMLAAGYVVAATDYEGLGTPGPHPYLVGASEGRSVLDAARAARRLVPEASGAVVTWGHSQGGQAALWAGELAPSYAPELALAGVAAFAPGARQDGLLDRGDDGPDPFLAGFTVAAVAGLAAAHPELEVRHVLTDGALARIGVLEVACIAQVLAAFAIVPGGVLRPEAAGLEDWQRVVRANQAGDRASPVPVLVLQGERDDLVRPASVERYRELACRNGIEVEVRFFRDADHTSIVDDGWRDAEAWSADRRAGRPPQTC